MADFDKETFGWILQHVQLLHQYKIAGYGKNILLGVGVAGMTLQLVTQNECFLAGACNLWSFS